jgi:hypothetical protein
MSIYNRLRLDIKHEQVEIKAEEVGIKAEQEEDVKIRKAA